MESSHNKEQSNETFSPVSTKDSFRVIMALVAHFDLHLHQMDVKTTFLNGNRASRQWYLKFDEVIKSQGFIDNLVDECIYMRFNGKILSFYSYM
ncbi:transposable element gene [Prunus dulcis]|uniref:Transposable element protein n=1 Tax=Prunus dulcis TaxID=3755 RepID=A0A4Y1RYI7_PRUDU|nr:transposable element gene [Prunus dulcis]